MYHRNTRGVGDGGGAVKKDRQSQDEVFSSNTLKTFQSAAEPVGMNTSQSVITDKQGKIIITISQQSVIVIQPFGYSA